MIKSLFPTGEGNQKWDAARDVTGLSINMQVTTSELNLTSSICTSLQVPCFKTMQHVANRTKLFNSTQWVTESSWQNFANTNIFWLSLWIELFAGSIELKIKFQKPTTYLTSNFNSRFVYSCIHIINYLFICLFFIFGWWPWSYL